MPQQAATKPTGQSVAPVGARSECEDWQTLSGGGPASARWASSRDGEGRDERRGQHQRGAQEGDSELHVRGDMDLPQLLRDHLQQVHPGPQDVQLAVPGVAHHDPHGVLVYACVPAGAP